jgi:hypothetical protein
MKKIVIHWPTLWDFCRRDTWAIPLAGSFFAGLMFASATVNFMFSRGFLAVSTIVCLLLTLIAIAAFAVTVYLLGKVYFVALLDVAGVAVESDAHIVDKLFAGKSMKGMNQSEINELLASDVDWTPELHQIVYKYRYKQDEYTKTYALENDEVFKSLEISQRIKIILLPFRSDIVRVDEHYLASQYREAMMNRWVDTEESYSLSQFRNNY